ncbi:MAG: hypothetical protein ABEK36_02100 [Candidatus Aenigmatarchaeota archaeon]
MEKMWGEPFRGGTTFSESFNACYANRPLRSGEGKYDRLSEARE